jgi:putative integral membrane protein (TIGR02587 family)
MAMDHGRAANGAGHPLVRLFAVEPGFYVALARAFAGAVLFALPLLMTMEMWWLGFLIRPERLALFLLVGIPLLWALAWMAGFRDDVGWRDALVDAGIAYLIGMLAAATVLVLLGAIQPGTSLYELAGKIAVQAVPAGMGATLARSQLGLQEEQKDVEQRRRESYAGELFLMGAGALFFSFNVAPTEEIVLIAHQQASPWYGVALVLVSVLVLHAFVYAIGFHGQHGPPGDRLAELEFLRLTLPGYGVVLLVCLYVLWTFGRLDGLPPQEVLHRVLVLAFPGSLGAATARLVL